MYIGMIARMLSNREADALESVFTGKDKVFLTVLLEILDRKDIQKILVQHENTIKLKKVTDALNLAGIKELLSIGNTPFGQKGLFGESLGFSPFSNLLSQEGVDAGKDDLISNKNETPSEENYSHEERFMEVFRPRTNEPEEIEQRK